jgi:hypothetical protein
LRGIDPRLDSNLLPPPKELEHSEEASEVLAELFKSIQNQTHTSNSNGRKSSYFPSGLFGSKGDDSKSAYPMIPPKKSNDPNSLERIISAEHKKGLLISKDQARDEYGLYW